MNTKCKGFYDFGSSLFNSNNMKYSFLELEIKEKLPKCKHKRHQHGLIKFKGLPELDCGR